MKCIDCGDSLCYSTDFREQVIEGTKSVYKERAITTNDHRSICKTDFLIYTSSAKVSWAKDGAFKSHSECWQESGRSGRIVVELMSDIEVIMLLKLRIHYDLNGGIATERSTVH